MAQGTSSSEAGAARGGQRRAETAAASDDTAKPQPPAERDDPRQSVLADSPEAHTDRVAMVSRDKAGNPDQAPGFEVLVDDEAAQNKPPSAS